MSITISPCFPPPSSGTACPLLHLLHLYATTFSFLLLAFPSFPSHFLLIPLWSCIHAKLCHHLSKSTLSPLPFIDHLYSLHFCHSLPRPSPLHLPLIHLFLNSPSSLKIFISSSDRTWFILLFTSFSFAPSFASFLLFLSNMQHLLSFSFYIHPSSEWVTWICLFALQPFPSAAQEHLRKPIAWLLLCPCVCVCVCV